MKGTVKWYNAAKGFGFIVPDEPGEDAFVHFSYILNRKSGTLVEGEPVEFDYERGAKGMSAKNIIVLKDADETDDVPRDAPIEQPDDVAVVFAGGKFRLVTVSRDGEYEYVDPLSNRHGILYVVGSDTAAYAMAVDEFEHLLNAPATREADLQRFFERNPDFILNDDYKAARSQVVLERDADDGPLIPDFLLEPAQQDGLCDILEIKRPQTQTFTIKQNRLRYSSAVFEACAQLRTYAQYFDDAANRHRVREKYGLEVFRPRLFLILGRRGKRTSVEHRLADADVNERLTVKTYDDILDRAKARLSRLRTGIRKKLPG